MRFNIEFSNLSALYKGIKEVAKTNCSELGGLGWVLWMGSATPFLGWNGRANLSGVGDPGYSSPGDSSD